MWYALRRLRIERELACDDCVIASGERASDDARELLQIARMYRPQRLALKVAMARTAKLDERIVGILDRTRSRMPVGRTLAVGLFIASVTLSVAVAATRFVEQAQAAAASQAVADKAGNDSREQTTSITGVVLNPDGQPAVGASVCVMRLNWNTNRPARCLPGIAIEILGHS